MSKTVTIINETGIHTRPGSVIVKKAKEFKEDGTQIMLSYNGKEAKADSLVKILSLGIKKDAEVTVSAEGPSAEKAVEEMAELLSTLVD
ncbi:HPr family phosphocarrier protein [Streptobacillus canis]|uniref:HPr family phosphocarrier protein n=1 Tax=Streptobacillus canis TaxID=2678686 RepID=UPI0012E2CCC6|nr:HPr family phosphocarrier protein [Streptobacillus canis]